MRFQDIPGLADIKQILVQSVLSNHVAHAQLFHGLSGSAALPMALAFASYLNCENRSETDACGECASCIKMHKIAHPDVTYIYPTAGGKKVLSENFIKEWREFISQNAYGELSDWLELIEVKQGNIPVEDMRQVIQNLSLKSYEGGYKIVMIWLPEFMGAPAANAILKVLEEPPADTVFFLITNNTDRLLTTITSRTQRLSVRALKDPELVDFLVKNQGLDEDKAQHVAFLSEGNINAALSLIHHREQNEKQWFANWMRYCYAFDVSKLVPLADEFDGLGKEAQRNLLTYGLKIIREIYLECAGVSNLIKLEGDELVFVQKFSKVFKFENIDKIMNILSEAMYHIERNARAKIVFLDSSLHIAKFIK